MQYKVLTQNSGLLSGKFSPEKLEDVLNDHAADGWRVIGTAAGQFPPLKHDQVIVLLEHP